MLTSFMHWPRRSKIDSLNTNRQQVGKEIPVNLPKTTTMIICLSMLVACGTDKPQAPAAEKKPTELEMHCE